MSGAEGETRTHIDPDQDGLLDHREETGPGKGIDMDRDDSLAVVGPAVLGAPCSAGPTLTLDTSNLPFTASPYTWLSSYGCSSFPSLDETDGIHHHLVLYLLQWTRRYALSGMDRINERILL